MSHVGLQHAVDPLVNALVFFGVLGAYGGGMCLAFAEKREIAAAGLVLMALVIPFIVVWYD